MTPEQQAAFVNSQTAVAMITAMGMVAANQHRLSLGQSIAYDEGAFNDLIAQHGLGHNDVVTFFHGGR
jgi:hypothetical protein